MTRKKNETRDIDDIVGTPQHARSLILLQHIIHVRASPPDAEFNEF